MSDVDAPMTMTLGGGNTTAAVPAGLEIRPRSLGIVNIFPETISGGMNALPNIFADLRSKNFNAVYLNPLFKPTQTSLVLGNIKEKQDNTYKPGSPYGMTEGVLNPKYTGGQQLDYLQSHAAMQGVAKAARDNGLLLIQDCVLNHIGHDSPIFDSAKWPSLLDDPIFGKLAAAAMAGKIDPNKMFKAVDEKRHPDVSATWCDVREFNLDTDEDVDNYIEYFAEPYFETLFEHGEALRVDACDQLLGHDGDNRVWLRVAEAMERTCVEKQGVKPTIMFETLGKAPSTYAPVFEAFPEEMKPSLHYCSAEMYRFTDKNSSHPIDTLRAISQNNFHPLYTVHHQEQQAMGMNGIAQAGTHDTKFGIADGYDVSSCIKRHLHFDQGMEIATRKEVLATLFLRNSSFMVRYGDERSFEHRQPEFWDAVEGHAPNDVTPNQDAEKFMREINDAREALYGNGQNYAWSESFLHEDSCHLMFALHRNDGRDPAIVLMNANKEARPPHKEGEGGDDKVALYRKMADELYASKHGKQGVPATTNFILIGEFADDVRLALTGKVQTPGQKAQHASPAMQQLVA